MTKKEYPFILSNFSRWKEAIILEETLLSIESIDEEIELCKDIISQFQSKLDELTKKTQLLTNRLNVLRAVEEKLPAGSTKQLNSANINMVADERFNLIPEINKQSSNIKHYQQILQTLIELKSEI